MRLHPLLLCLTSTLVAACSSSSPTSPSPTTNSGPLVVVTITPNPMQRRAAGEQIVWNVTFRDGGTTGVRVDRSEASVLDASGTIFAERKDFWSKSAGCSECNLDLHLTVGGAAVTFSGLTAGMLATPSAGALFRFTTFFMDDSGAVGSISTDIPLI
jgi:hypothetical protein